MKLKTRILPMILVLGLIVSLCMPAFAAGEKETIYIETVEEFLEFSENCTLDSWSQGKTVKLTEDLALDGVAFTPIPTFGGTFVGGGHTISGLELTGSVTPAGLFGQIQAGGIVKDLNVSGAVAPAGDAVFVGGIVGENYGTVKNCSFSGNVLGSESVGGIAGVNAAGGQIRYCTASGAIIGEDMTGGVVGCNLGTVKSCENRACVNTVSVDPTLTPDDINFDFLLDISKLSSLDTSTATMDTGGIAGYSSGILTDCGNEGLVGYPHIGYNVGGIVGRSSGYVSDCENTAVVYGRKDVGGIAGQMEPFVAKNITESALATLQEQLSQLDALLDQIQSNTDETMGTLSNRIEKIADAVDHAAAAAKNINTYGSVTGSASGSGEASAGGSVTADPSDADVSGDASVGGSVSAEPAGASASAGAGSGIAAGGVISGSGAAAGAGSGLGVGVEISADPGGISGNASASGDLSADLTEGNVSGDGSASASGNLSASAQIYVTTSLGALSSAIYGMSGQMRLLNEEIDASSGTLGEDLEALQEQINAISDTAFSILEGDETENLVVDSSEIDIDLVTLGKVDSCVNSGAIDGDINVGGVTGTMAVESELDPEDDITVQIDAAQSATYEIKAIIGSCVNTGTITAKRSYAGGICGRMDLGLILRCESYGDISSESGSYVGGIAGIAGATVQSCFVKCTLSGGKYVGGVVGAGVAEDLGGQASTVTGCYSMVAVSEYEQYAGAISGGNTGNFVENYFVSDALAGINGISLAGKAEPMDYEQLLDAFTDTEETGNAGDTAESLLDGFSQLAEDVLAEVSAVAAQDAAENLELPDDFQQFTLRFVADGEELKSETFDFGDSFDASVFPEIPEKEGYYAQWDTTELENLQFDTVVTAVYTPYVTALNAAEVRSDGRAVFLAQGSFREEDTLDVQPMTQTPEEFEALPDGTWETIRKCFAGTTLATDVAEQWQVILPDDGSDVHTLRYLPAGGETDGLQVYVKQDGAWCHVETETIGRCLVFPVMGETVQVAVLSTMAVWWVWGIAGGLLVLILALLVLLIRRRRKKKGKKPRKEKAGEKKAMKKRTKILLTMLGVLLAAAVAAGIWFLASGKSTELAAYRLISAFAEETEGAMTLDVSARADDTDLDFSAQIQWGQAEGHDVTRIWQEDLSLYYIDGVVFLENGTAYQFDGDFPDYGEILGLTAQLYQHVEITAQGDDYIITAEQADAAEILSLLMPSAAELIPENPSLSVVLTAPDGVLETITFAASGTLTDGESFEVSAVVTPEKQVTELVLPQAVSEALSSGEYEAELVLTGPLVTLVQAAAKLYQAESAAAEIHLTAEGGPLVVSETLTYCSSQVDGTPIGSIQKSGYGLYFTDDAVCDASGNTLLSTEQTLTRTPELLELALGLCMEGDFRYEAGVYTLSLDEETMEELAAIIAPDTELMEVHYGQGSVAIRVDQEKTEIAGISIACEGSVEVVLLEVPVSIQAEIEMTDMPEDYAVPEAVIDTLVK